MKCLYIIVSAAAYRYGCEQEIWELLKTEGLQVRDIHELPRIGQHEIALANASIAKLVKKRFESEQKDVRLVCLLSPKELLAQHLGDFSEEQIETVYSDIQSFALNDADYCVPYDDPALAAGLLAQIIKNEESEQ